MNSSINKNIFLFHTDPASRKIAQRLSDLLEAQNISCSIAPRDLPSHADWDAVLPLAISQCNVVVQISDAKHLNTSELIACTGWAQYYKKLIVPLAITPLKPTRQLEKLALSQRWQYAVTLTDQATFQHALNSIKTALQSSGVSLPQQPQSELLEQAQTLAQNINNAHIMRFDAIQAYFTLRPEAAHSFNLHFPLRLGSCNIDIHFFCDTNLQYISFYANFHNKSHELKTIFLNICKRLLAPILKDTPPPSNDESETDDAQFYKYQESIPSPSSSPALTPFYFFEEYSKRVQIFVENVLPTFLDWVDYGSRLEGMLNTLIEQLKQEFPQEQGWHVEAHSGNYLTDFRPIGSVDIFRDSWLADDDKRHRGQLTLRIQADEALLSRIKIGIFKRERTLRLEGWQTRLLETCTTHLGAPTFESSWWVWCKYLPSPWDESGLKTFEPQWPDPEGFMQVCLAELLTFKKIIPLIDTVHQTLPLLQAAPFENLDDAPWAAFLLRSALNHTIDTLKNDTDLKVLEPSLHWKIRLEEPPSTPEHIHAQIYASIKTGEFEYILLAECTPKSMQLSIQNWTPPYFEIQFIRQFLQAFFPTLHCSSSRENLIFSTRTALSLFDTLTPSQWLVTFEHFVIEETKRIVPFLQALQEHLEQCRKLISKTEALLLYTFPPDQGWRIQNHASALNVPHGGFLIWHSSWEAPQTPNTLPPIVLHLGSASRLFDQIFWGLHTTTELPLEQNSKEITSLIHLCEELFGKGHTGEFAWLWWTRARAGLHNTGCRTLTDKAQNLTKQNQFLGSLITELKRLKPLSSLMEQANQAAHKQHLLD